MNTRKLWLNAAQSNDHTFARVFLQSEVGLARICRNFLNAVIVLP